MLLSKIMAINRSNGGYNEAEKEDNSGYIN